MVRDLNSMKISYSFRSLQSFKHPNHLIKNIRYVPFFLALFLFPLKNESALFPPEVRWKSRPHPFST